MGVALAVVSLRAADGRPWTGEKALGDVAVSFDGTVQFYGNDGSALGTLTFASTATGGLGISTTPTLNPSLVNTGHEREPCPEPKSSVRI